METKLRIDGTYTFQGSKLVSPDKPFYLVLDHRKQTATGKPPAFIIAKTTDGTFPDGRRDRYISSVYPVSGQFFHRIEFQGINYRFEITETGATVTAWSAQNRTEWT